MISWSIRVVNLDENPKYTALSYTWRKQLSPLQVGASMLLEVAKASYRGKQFDMEFPDAELELRTPKTILCNGKKISITSNLYDALPLFRQTRPDNGECWIDAIYMNQRYLSSSLSCPIKRAQ